ncbi:hypothetical protein TNCV_886951 [Trichonephila clavipes]|uniref:Uncharacterized protein n=1 Tax=Trichonephila clavipes TaxID=2585209 RepID=A0A8X6RIE2_TRICX|nr:hypothetical protein TNCV_886951 [Trichonephila clavipes]
MVSKNPKTSLHRADGRADKDSSYKLIIVVKPIVPIQIGNWPAKTRNLERSDIGRRFTSRTPRCSDNEDVITDLVGALLSPFEQTLSGLKHREFCKPRLRIKNINHLGIRKEY